MEKMEFVTRDRACMGAFLEKVGCREYALEEDTAFNKQYLNLGGVRMHISKDFYSSLLDMSESDRATALRSADIAFCKIKGLPDRKVADADDYAKVSTVINGKEVKAVNTNWFLCVMRAKQSLSTTANGTL